MPFKKTRNVIINKKQRRPTMNKPKGRFKYNEQIGKARKARSKFDEKIDAEDIDNIPGIEILKEKDERTNSNN